MQELKEPAPYAAGGEILERAECRVGLRPPQKRVLALRGLFFSILTLLVLVGLLALPSSTAILVMVAGWVFLGLNVVGILRFRVVADSEGIRQRGVLRQKFVPWADINFYALTWPVQGRPPDPAGDDAMTAVMSAKKWRALRIPGPEELAVILGTNHGLMVIAAHSTGREDVCRMIRQRAVNAKTKRWLAVEYFLRGSREFTYQRPNWKTQLRHILLNPYSMGRIWLAAIWLGVWLLFTVPVSPALFGCCLGLGFIGLLAPLFRMIQLDRECRRRMDEAITVTETELTWTKGAVRVVIPYEEIRELSMLPEVPLLGQLGSWRVATHQAEVVFSTVALVTGGGLPAIIYNRGPQLWVRGELIARPG